MNERDTLQLFDLGLAREIIPMEREELWQFCERRLDEILALPKRRSVFILPEHIAAQQPRWAFDRFFDDDPADVKQSLIEDFCCRGPEIVVGYYARCGYLDDASSAEVLTSEQLFPWPPDSEAWYWCGRFDLLDASHIRLMSASLEKYRSEVPADEYAIQKLQLNSLADACATDPGLRATYRFR
jgi:hypothetical protein